MKKRILDRISSITVLRHGKAAKVNPEDSDEQRQLTEMGRSQAENAATALRYNNYDIVVSSPLRRAMDTTRIVGGGQGPEPIKILGPSSDPKDPLNIMFEKLAYSPLVGEPDNSYFGHELGDRLKDWARKALTEILQKCEEFDDTGTLDVLVGGHAVCQPAIIWALCEALGVEANQVPGIVTRYNLGEAEAIMVIIESGRLNISLLAPEIGIPE